MTVAFQTEGSSSTVRVVRRGDAAWRKISKTVLTVMTTLAANLITSSRLYQMPKPLLMRSEAYTVKKKVNDFVFAS